MVCEILFIVFQKTFILSLETHYNKQPSSPSDNVAVLVREIYKKGKQQHVNVFGYIYLNV